MKKIILLLALAGVGLFAYSRYGASDPDEKATVVRAPVVAGAVTQSVAAIGTLQPIRTSQVGPQVSGTVKELFVEYNSPVKKDQIVATLDPTLLEVQVAVQEANLARQEGDIAQQKIVLANAQTILARTQAEFDKGLVTLQQLEAAKLQVKSRAADVAASESLKVQTQAQLDRAKLNVSYCVVRAPFDGVILQRFVDVGQFVQASVRAPTFFLIGGDLATLRLQAGVDEADIGRLRPGMPVTFTVAAYKGETFHGRVEAVRLNAQNLNSVVTYPVWIEVPNDDLRLRPGMTANIQLAVASVENATLVPNDALMFRTNAEMYTWLKLPPPTNIAAQRLAPPESMPADDVRTTPRERATKIDDLFAPFPRQITGGQVWVYDEANSDPSRRMRPILLRLGLSNGQMTEVISGDVRPGMELLTSVQPPPSYYERRSSLFGGPQRRGGGMQRGEAEGPSRLQRPGRPGGAGGGRRGG